MGKGNATSLDVLKMVFLGTDPALRAYGTLYISLHTADPTAGGTQTNNETAYSNYTRQAVVQTAGGWTVAGTSSSNAALITFPACGVTGSTVTYVAIGQSNTGGAGQILYSGVLNQSLVIATGVSPQFAINALTVTEA